MRCSDELPAIAQDFQVGYQQQYKIYIPTLNKKMKFSRKKYRVRNQLEQFVNS
jgi:hypothetical protein